MEDAWGLAVDAQDAEATRRRLQEENLLRVDLKVQKEDGRIWLPVASGTPGAVPHAFASRSSKPKSYWDLLPRELRDLAPRAFDQLGSLVLIKVPADFPDPAALGEALLAFVPAATGVFADGGVTGEYRTRDLQCLAGNPATLTCIKENGVQLWVDPAKAYFSPRLAHERQVVCATLRPGAVVLDLFGGVAPFSVQAAKQGATVTCNDLNPEAVVLARRNAKANHVEMVHHELDAFDLIQQWVEAGQRADHVMMNLPHHAKMFLAAAKDVVAPGGILHHHEILEIDDLPRRRQEILELLGPNWTLTAERRVRAYAATMEHRAMDFRRQA